MNAHRQELDAILKDAAMAELSENIERALAGYDAALRIGPIEERAHMGKCSLLRRTGRYEDAAACAAAFAAARPDSATAHHEFGLCLLHLKRYEEAVKAFEKALALQPAFKAAWSNMGIALARLGDVDRAMACYDRAAGKAPLLSVPAAPPFSAKRDFEEALHGVLSGMMDSDGGCVHIFSGQKFSFRVSVSLLIILLKDYDMDGVVVSMANPSLMYRRVLEKRVVTKHPPYYIDVLASPASGSTSAPVPVTERPTVPAKTTEIMSASASAQISAFELDKIAAAVRMGLQRVAERYSGEEHFVLLDDIASVEFYNGPQTVQKFLRDFFSDLSRLNIFCFVVQPDRKEAVLEVSSFFSRRGKLRVRSEWFIG
jgi:tetratricopeptide (TPR) repeat protein